MSRCLKCNLDFGEHVPELCPVCKTIPYVCPWCGSMTDVSARVCTAEGCGRPIKYVQVPPDNRDVMRLKRGEALQVAGVTVVIEKALYATERATVYRGKVADNITRHKAEPDIGSVVVVREVVDEWTAQVQAMLGKLLELRHPNIVRTYAGQPDPDRCCYRLLQSWIGERSLADTYLEEYGGHAAPPVELGKTAVTLANAVRYLHQQGIIHCDITPFNVLVSDDGNLVLSDFGIAVPVDNPGPPRGYSSSYAPVELYPSHNMPADLPAPGWSISASTDRYMLGATLYSIACGRDGRSEHPITRTCVLVPPIERLLYEAGLGGTPQTPLRALNPDIDEGFAACVEQLLSIAPEKRFNSDSRMVKSLTRAAKNLGKRRRFKWFKLAGAPGSKKMWKAAGTCAGVVLLMFLSHHSYTLMRSPARLFNFAIADIYTLFGQHRSALIELSNVHRSAEAEYAKGRALERLGEPDNALERYKESIAIDPGYKASVKAAARVRSNLGHASLQLGMQLYRSGEYYKAYQHLTKAVHCGVYTPRAYEALANIAERRGELVQAARYWDSVCRFKPEAIRPHYEAALLFMDTGNLEKAYHHTAKARDLRLRPGAQENISADDAADLLAEVSSACLRAGAMDVSRATSTRRIYDKMVWLNRARNLNPSADVLITLGRYHERLGDLSSGDRRINAYAKAVECLESARKLAPKSPTVNTVLARCLVKQKKASEAAGA